jgi:YHS domain-containing protein
MKHLILGLLFIGTLGLSTAQTTYFNTNGVAINGYDPVAYFNENVPVEGIKDFTYKWEGTEWYFKNKANLELFRADPRKYAPQFGGFCAYGVSEDHKSPTDPHAFTVVNNRLYLNYSPKVKQLWTRNRDERIKTAEVNWIGLQKQTELNLDDGIAIQGYDPVAYFTSKEAVEGKKEFQYQHENATYYFSSSATRDAFIKNPSAYKPQYGGWCAYAMGASGEKVEIDPETFKVFDGKLYLFYNAYFNNTLPKWNKDETDLKTKADENWKAIINK